MSASEKLEILIQDEVAARSRGLLLRSLAVAIHSLAESLGLDPGAMLETCRQEIEAGTLAQGQKARLVAIKAKLAPAAKPARRHRAKNLTEAQRKAIGAELATGMSAVALARAYHCSVSTIYSLKAKLAQAAKKKPEPVTAK